MSFLLKIKTVYLIYILKLRNSKFSSNVSCKQNANRKSLVMFEKCISFFIFMFLLFLCKFNSWINDFTLHNTERFKIKYLFFMLQNNKCFLKQTFKFEKNETMLVSLSIFQQNWKVFMHSVGLFVLFVCTRVQFRECF